MLTIKMLEEAWVTFNKPMGVPPLIVSPRMYSETMVRVKRGEDVRLPISGLQFYVEKDRLYLRWPVSADERA
jgi:hypothetical protein